jgi:hypothetical protein
MSSFLEQHQWKLVNRLIRWFSWSETGFKANLPTHNNNRDAKTSLYNQLRFTEPWMRAFRSRAAEEFWTAVKSSHDRASIFANISHLFEVWPRLSPMPLLRSLCEIAEKPQFVYVLCSPPPIYFNMANVLAVILHVEQILKVRDHDPLADLEDEAHWCHALVHVVALSRQPWTPTQQHPAEILQQVLKRILLQPYDGPSALNKSPPMIQFFLNRRAAQRRSTDVSSQV